MPGPHCPTCAAYEERVTAKAPGEALPSEVMPCKGFVMSDQFRDWAVGEMRREVMGQVSMAGLDRMALVRAKPSEPATEGRRKAPSGNGAGGAHSHQSRNK